MPGTAVMSIGARHELEISPVLMGIKPIFEITLNRFSQFVPGIRRKNLVQYEESFFWRTLRNKRLRFILPATLFLAGIPDVLKAQQETSSLNISEIGPILEPEAVHFSFQTPGWYFLFGVVFILACFFVFKWLTAYRKNAYRREALRNLSVIENRFNVQNDTSCVIDALVLLKLVGIQSFQREKVAQLHGNEWLKFLEEKGKETPFQKYSESISAALYQSGKVEKNEVQQIMELTKKWIKTHA